MFWAVLLTILFCALGFLVWAFRDALLRQRSVNDELQEENAYLNGLVHKHREFESKRMRKAAYYKGLYDGRETDMVYRDVLKRYKDGEYDEKIFAYMSRQEGSVRK